MILRSIRSKLLGLVLAAIIPFVAFIGVALWVQWQDIQATAIRQTMNDARLLAAQVDDHIGNLEHLLVGLSHTVSTSAYDVSLNDALLQQVRAELPNFISNIYLLDLDGNLIGSSSIAPDRPLNVADRVYFREVLAGQHLVIGGVVRSRLTREWVMPIARPVEDRAGQLRAVIVVGTKLEHFQEAFRLNGLPRGSIVRIVNEHGIVVSRSEDGPSWIGRDLSNSEQIVRHMAAKEASEVTVWPDGC